MKMYIAYLILLALFVLDASVANSNGDLALGAAFAFAAGGTFSLVLDSYAAND